MKGTCRRETAFLLTLAIMLSLVLVCCACGHAAVHAHGDDCPLCQVARRQGHLIGTVFAVAAVCVCCVSLTGRLPYVAIVAGPFFTPITLKVRLND